WTEGRAAGEKGEYLAADYIASMLQLYGIKPGGDPYRPRVFSSTPGGSERTYFQNFTLLKTMPGNDQVFKIKTADGSTIKTITLTYNVDYVLRSLRQDIEIDAPVVFAGYGFKNEKLNFNDYANIEVKGKFILKIAGNPPFAREKLSLPELSASSSETESMLRSMGAVGVIEYNTDMTVVGVPQSPEFMNMSPAEGRPRSGRASAYFSIPGKTNPESLIRISTSVKAANEILRGTGIVIEDYIKSAGTGKPVRIPPLTGKYVYMKSEVLTTSVMVRNVVGIIEGNNPDQVIVLGAHYDHMGSGNGFIWNGADDNASGTVGVMTAAKAIMATGRKPDKTIIVALWTSEEEGLLGSQYYVENLTYPLKNLRLYLNYDMISRYISDDKPNGVIMVYNKSYSQFKNLTEANLKKYSINLTVDYQASDNPAGPSDESSFVEAGVPIIRLKTAHREEYHTPADEFTTIDWDIMEKIVKINFLNVWTLANSQNW
ncbi:MAG: M20/M25/M40 family metallo-hydrolase, partial [Bacteroidales bacterium]|nr:M20/M25/M40 family metallo-hydrolase [Bacteroidales bacterium]